MIRLLLALPFLLLVAAAPAPVVPAPAASITPAQAQQALDVLKDDAKRAQFIAVLEAIAKAAPAAEPKLDIPLAPNSLGAQVLMDASNHLSTLSDELVATARTV